jgi:hypothetical protein
VDLAGSRQLVVTAATQPPPTVGPPEAAAIDPVRDLAITPDAPAPLEIPPQQKVAP